jgi:hypothetical protein
VPQTRSLLYSTKPLPPRRDYCSFCSVDGVLSLPDPQDACAAIHNNVTGSIVIVERGGCTFAAKVRNAACAGAKGVVVFNYVQPTSHRNEHELIIMGPEELTPAGQQQGYQCESEGNKKKRRVTADIPSVFISYSSGVYLLHIMAIRALQGDVVRIIITGEGDNPFLAGGIPFTAATILHLVVLLFGIIWILMIMVVLCSCSNCYLSTFSRSVRLQARSSLLLFSDTLTSIFNPHICSICLDYFAEGDTIRRLPCSHQYHSRCVSD